MAMESSVIPRAERAGYAACRVSRTSGKDEYLDRYFLGNGGEPCRCLCKLFRIPLSRRPLLLKYGKYVWITEEKFTKVEKYFLEHGEISTFIG